MLTLAFLCLAAPGSALAAGSISGAVTEEAAGHAPVAAVRVCAIGKGEEEFEPQLGVNCELTDSNGIYTIHNLPANDYVVDFWPGYEGLNYVAELYDDTLSWFEADTVTVTTGARTGIDAELTVGGELQGTVVSEIGGTPIVGVVVCAEQEEEPWYFECAETDGAGEYTIPGLVEGEYWVEFWPPDGSLLAQSHREIGVSQSAVTVEDAALSPGAEITGQLTDAATNGGIAEVLVCATPANEEELLRCAETGFTGLYSMSGLSPGSYKVVFAPFADEEEAFFPESRYRTQYFSAKSSWSAADPITLAAGAVRGGVNAALARKSTASQKPAASQSPALSVPVVGPPTSHRAPKPHCRKGFKKRLVKGKQKCVKRKRKHHRSGPRARGRALHARPGIADRSRS